MDLDGLILRDLREKIDRRSMAVKGDNDDPGDVSK